MNYWNTIDALLREEWGSAHTGSMSRVITIANGKGGVGKTSMTSGLAGLLASAGSKVLVIDCDPQGNLCRDLGYPEDSGAGLAAAIVSGRVPSVIEGVRDGLDAVPGGMELFDVAPAVVARRSRGTDIAGLAPIIGMLAGYDFVLIDTPPGEPMLQEIAFRATDYLLIPTRSDEASLDGLSSVARRFAAVKKDNPSLTLLGVVLFGIRRGSTRIERDIRSALSEILGDVAPVFNASIRYLESASVDMRRRGILPHEMSSHQSQARKERIARLSSGQGVGDDDLFSRDSGGLASDFDALATEMIKRIAEVDGSRHGGEE